MRSFNIYIFGAHGFIGANLSQQLAELKIYHFRVVRKAAMGTSTGGDYSKDLTLDQALSEIAISNQPCLLVNCIGLTKFDGDNCFEEMLESNFEIPSRITKSIEKNPSAKVLHLSTELVKSMNDSNREQYKLTKKLGDNEISSLGSIRHKIIYLPLVLSTNNKSSSLVSELKKMKSDNYVPEIINPNLIVNFCTLSEIRKYLISFVSTYVARKDISSLSELITYRLTINEIFEIKKLQLENSSNNRDLIIQQIRKISSENFMKFKECSYEGMNQILTALENI